MGLVSQSTGRAAAYFPRKKKAIFLSVHILFLNSDDKCIIPLSPLERERERETDSFLFLTVTCVTRIQMGTVDFYSPNSKENNNPKYLSNEINGDTNILVEKEN